MTELITEILIFLAIAAILGLLIGYLIWGWSRRGLIAAARAEGAAGARTSVDGSSGLRQQLDACAEERAVLERENDALQLRIDAFEAEQTAVSELQSGDDDDGGAAAESAMADLRAELDAALLARTEAEAENARLSSQVAALDAAGKSAQSDAATALALRAQLDAAKAERAGLQTRIASLEAAAGDASSDAAAVSELRAQLDACAAARASLESENAALQDRLDVMVGAQPLAPEQQNAAVQTPVEAAPAPASLLTERPDEVDDLKEIKGVGPKMEGVLNDKGVYLFRQVANFSAQDVAWVNEAIEAFPGRIERDQWVAQAQTLYLAKYGKGHND